MSTAVRNIFSGCGLRALRHGLIGSNRGAYVSIVLEPLDLCICVGGNVAPTRCVRFFSIHALHPLRPAGERGPGDVVIFKNITDAWKGLFHDPCTGKHIILDLFILGQPAGFRVEIENRYYGEREYGIWASGSEVMWWWGQERILIRWLCNMKCSCWAVGTRLLSSWFQSTSRPTPTCQRLTMSKGISTTIRPDTDLDSDFQRG